MFWIILIVFIVIIVFTIIFATRAAVSVADEVFGKDETDEYVGNDEDVGNEEEYVGNDEDVEDPAEVVGSYEFVPNRIKEVSMLRILKKNTFTDFIKSANLANDRLICIVGLPFTGVEKLAEIIHKKFGHKIIGPGTPQEQRKQFRDQPGKFVIQYCEEKNLDILFKGKPVDRNFVLLFVHPRDSVAVGRLTRHLRTNKKDDSAVKEFIDKYDSLDKRQNLVDESEALQKVYSARHRVYVVRTSYTDY